MEAATGAEALEIARRQRPRVAILEVSLRGTCGYEVCRRLREEFGESMSIVLVSATRTESYDRVAGLLLGADDYLAKPLAADEFLARLARYFSRHRSGMRVRSVLTAREQQVLDLLGDGLRQREIAERLGIRPKTVGTHLEHIYSKLGARHRLQALAMARKQGLVAHT
jgi:DNA-binding NarL/FixJ family response regulator